MYKSLKENDHSPIAPSAVLAATAILVLLAVAVLVLLFELFVTGTTLPAQVRHPLSATQIVNQMVRAEAAAVRNRQHFLYRKEERSNRTKGHLWDELVVETSDGPMQRLISEDGKPLSNSQKKAEDQRITYLANHPDKFRREAQRRKEDEARMPDLLKEIPKVFLFKTVSSGGTMPASLFSRIRRFRRRVIRTVWFMQCQVCCSSIRRTCAYVGLMYISSIKWSLAMVSSAQ